MRYMSRMTTRKKELGQYFTTNADLLNAVRDLVRNHHGPILEPSRGAGHIVRHLRQESGIRDRPWVTVEIDDTINTVLPNEDGVLHYHGDFLEQDLGEMRFETIVGNPPYVKQKGKPNLYVQFLNRCMDLLSEHGEMIMIIPTDFLSATGAKYVRERMVREGRVTDVFRPDSENLFEGASQDVIVLRYQQGTDHSEEGVMKHNGGVARLIIRNGVFIIADATAAHTENTLTIADMFHVKVGMVSGADAIFRNDILGNAVFYTRRGDQKRYIFIRDMPSGDPEIDDFLRQHKETLMARRIRKFNDKNWFEWGAIRNIEFMEADDADCIYIETLTRDKRVAFRGKRAYFDGNLLCLAPKQPMSSADLDAWVAFFNSPEFQKPYIQSGRFKMGQHIMCSACAPAALTRSHRS